MTHDALLVPFLLSTHRERDMSLAASLPDIDEPGPVRQLGAEIRDAGHETLDLVSSAQAEWVALAGTFQADNTEKAYEAMDTPKAIASDVQASTDGIKSALDDYASKLSELQRRKRQLEREIAAAERALAAAEAMPKTKAETGPDGEEREVPNEEREEAIAEAEAELSRLETEVQQLCDDVKSADEDLAARFNDNGFEMPDAGEGREGRDGNWLMRFGQGAWDALVDTGKAFWALGKSAVNGVRYAFEHRQEIFDAAKGLDDFVKNGGLGRMRDSLAIAAQNFDAKDTASTVVSGTKNWVSNEWQEFNDDRAYYLGRVAPDAIMTVASGGTGGLAKMGATAGAKATAGAAAKGGAAALARGGAAASLRGAGKAGALAAGKTGLGEAARASLGAMGAAGVTRTGAKAATGALDDVARIGASGAAHSADDLARSGARTVTQHGDTVGKAGASHANHAGAAAAKDLPSQPTLKQQLASDWEHHSKKIDEPIDAVDYYESRGRADLANKYLEEGNESMAAAAKYLFNTDNVHGQHTAMKHEEVLEKTFGRGEDGTLPKYRNPLKHWAGDEWRNSNHKVVDGSYVRPEKTVVPLEDRVARTAGDTPHVESEVIDAPDEGIRYVDSKVGQNRFEFDMAPHYEDHRATIFETFKDAPRLDQEAGQKAIEELGKEPTDNAGHKQAHSWAANLGAGNYLPQDTRLNSGPYNQLESVIRDAVKPEHKSYVESKAHVKLEESGRPIDYLTEITLRDRETRKQWADFSVLFENNAEQRFSRNPNKYGVTDQPDVRERNFPTLREQALGGDGD